MSSEIDISSLVYSLVDPLDSESLELPQVIDRVLRQSDERPDGTALPPLIDPAADHEFEDLKRRRDDVEEKHQRIRDYLDETGIDAVILGRADSVAWFTAGGDLRVHWAGETASVLLFINKTSRAVITDNVQSARVFEEELAGLGFQLKERPWFDEPGRLVDELSHGRRVVSDLDRPVTPWSSAGSSPLDALRWSLTKRERQELRKLGRTLAWAVEATCQNFDPGETEAAVAGHLAHRLIREGIVPVDLRVAGDDRLAHYRQPAFKAIPIQNRATITVTGRRLGLCATLSRSVAFGAIDDEYRHQHQLAAMVDATAIFFSRPGEAVSEVFRRARRIFEKFDHPHEWTLDYLGFVLGYSPREVLLTPDSSLALGENIALGWAPSVCSARSSDTVVIDWRGYEILTQGQNWPQIEVAVKGYNINRPGVLIR